MRASPIGSLLQCLGPDVAGAVTPPTKPTATVVDDETGTSFTVTIDGQAGATNYVFYKRSDHDAWSSDSRSGDGDVQVTDLRNNTWYDVLVQSFADDVYSHASELLRVKVTEGAITAPAEIKEYRNYWFDWETKGFWPAELQTEHQATAVLEYNVPTSRESVVLFGGYDGFIRQYVDGAELDDGNEIESHIVYGPVRLGGDDYRDGMLQELSVALGEDSGDVDWSVVVGSTHERLTEEAAFATGTFTVYTHGGLNYVVRPRARGGSFALRLSNGQSGRAWSIEKATMVQRRLGRQRLL